MPCGLIGMYWTKCKQSNSHTSLTTLCSPFLLSWGNQAMTKSAHWWLRSCDLHGWSGWKVSRKYSRRLYRNPQKFIFSILTSKLGRMTNACILCDLLWKVQKSHVANREGSFNTDSSDFTFILPARSGHSCTFLNYSGEVFTHPPHSYPQPSLPN